ncbi:MAG TPA: DUF488 family protein [Clostridia bacterium]|nr:DUF488 family protein [Clostridia bacterium]
MPIAIKRAYETPTPDDGFRVLVDRLWPRGIKKDDAQIDLWVRDLSPSDNLRKWFHAHTTQWLTFRRRYLAELAQESASESLEQLHEVVRSKRMVTLVYSARDPVRNNAVVLKQLLDGARKPPSSTGPVKEGATAARRARARR